MVSSSLENTILEDIWGIEAVSTFKILQLANDAGIPVFTIDAANRSTLVPQLTHSAATVSQIEAALDAGFHVEVPRDPITLLDWTGTGWLTIDAALGIPLAWQITGFLQGGSLAEIVQHLQELVRTGEITEMEANLILFALFERIHAPVQDAVSSPYGPRRHPITGEQNSFHEGVDYASGTDTPVATVADGFIEVQYISGSFGNTIIINHGVDAQGNTHYTLYAHNNSFEMSLDDFVSQGDIVSLSGNTGSSTNPHVHFELRIVPPGVDGPLPVNGAPTNGAFFDQELTVDPETYVWPEELLLACSPVCP